MNSGRIVIVGGGAAGFFAALACAEENSSAEVIVLEKTSQPLHKVKISGGGRCNVTHALINEREFVTRYPRGERTLIAPFKKFSASDTVEWFAHRGVKLKTEGDGRMFPVTDSSQTIIDCLLNAARQSAIQLRTNCGVERVIKDSKGQFELTLANSESGRDAARQRPASAARYPSPTLICDQLLLATGGCRTPALGQLAISLGHTLEPPVPSLFTFCIETPWLKELAGVAVENVEASVPDCKLRERGALLITHWGLSGPAILRLSAWGARQLHEKDYHFTVCINWLPHLTEENLVKEFQTRRESQGAKLIVNVPVAPLPSRLWEKLVLTTANVPIETRWSAFPRALQNKLIQQLLRTEFPVTGKSLNKDEFVTCGGVKLSEVNFKTMESKLCPGLFFAGELLDIDGITGGFNFQAAWTTGWIAGKAMARSIRN
jgi:predicted Rossmann fold flavoprotein